MMASGLNFPAAPAPVEDEEEGPIAHGQRLVAVLGVDMAVEGAATQDGAVASGRPRNRQVPRRSISRRRRGRGFRRS